MQGPQRKRPGARLCLGHSLPGLLHEVFLQMFLLFEIEFLIVARLEKGLPMT